MHTRAALVIAAVRLRGQARFRATPVPRTPAVGAADQRTAAKIERGKVPWNDGGGAGVLLREWDHECVGWVHSLVSWFGTSRAGEKWSDGAYHCPRCGQELPALRPGARALNPMGPMWLPPTSQELAVAKCPFDGHSPYNDVAKAMLLDGRLWDTRPNDGAR